MSTEYERYFKLTHAAVNGIENENLRNDFSSILNGVEYALNKGDIELANVCIERIRVLAHSLCRTIGGPVAVAIIDGLTQDGSSVGQEQLQYPRWKDDSRCDTTGSRQCVSAKRSRCHSDSAGCMSQGQDPDIAIAAGYVWGDTLI